MKGRPQYILRYDEHGRKHEAYMTVNCLDIDPKNQEFKCRMLNSSTYKANLIHETLELVALVHKKYSMEDDRNISRNPTCIQDALEQ